jgi:hypothetical protein
MSTTIQDEITEIELSIEEALNHQGQSDSKIHLSGDKALLEIELSQAVKGQPHNVGGAVIGVLVNLWREGVLRERMPRVEISFRQKALVDVIYIQKE